MPSQSAVTTNRFTPQVAQPQFLAPAGTTQADTAARISTAQAAFQEFLAAHPGQANLAFDPGTSGDSTYLNVQGLDINQTITRGYIRRSAPSASDPMSKAQLNFMYNPESVVRDYVSYLDQEALDPFNTVYQSGNLIAPPSFINFSFDLFFDRQVQATNGQIPRGVLEDYDFFDIVVRNVVPGGGTTAVPDNGIMMVNPKDIMVVFSKDLSVQGRPTNARVTFERFMADMTPTRMTISLTMIVTYFGPIRDAFTFDTSQAIGQWEGTIPYSKVYSEEFTAQEAAAAKNSFQNISSVTPATGSGTAAAATTGAGVAAVAGPASGSLAIATLKLMMENIHPNGGTKYVWGASDLPTKADCSGALWWCYGKCGAQKVLGGRDTAAIRQHGISTNWQQSLQLICIPGKTSPMQLKQLLRAGDIILRSPSQGHVGLFTAWVNVSSTTNHDWYMTHQTDAARNGTHLYHVSYMQTFNYIIRPHPTGGTTSTGAWT